MVKRLSALDGHDQRGVSGLVAPPGVTLCAVGDLRLHQIAAWPDTLAAVAVQAAAMAGVPTAPAACRAVEGTVAALLRVEPLKWWLIGAEAGALEAHQGTTLDLSHSRTQIRVSGAQAVALLNRHLPLDLREPAFPVGALAATALHHAGVMLWRSSQGYELFLPRGFALSIWQILLQTAAQFGAEVA